MFVPKGWINNSPALVQIMAWCWPGNKQLSEPMMGSLLMHIYSSLCINELRAFKSLLTPCLSVCLYVCPLLRLSVCLSVNLSCPPCSIYSSGWILSIFGTNDHQHGKVCRMWWPLTLTYIFKVIRLWLKKSCPLCNVYSSRWILFIFGTNDHYN